MLADYILSSDRHREPKASKKASLRNTSYPNGSLVPTDYDHRHPRHLAAVLYTRSMPSGGCF